MTPKEYHLLCTEEECLEVALAAGELQTAALKMGQAVSKVMRFTETHARSPAHLLNYEQLQLEYNDLLATVKSLEQFGIFLSENVDAVVAKQSRIEYYKNISLKLGVIVDASPN